MLLENDQRGVDSIPITVMFIPYYSVQLSILTVQFRSQTHWTRF